MPKLYHLARVGLIAISALLLTACTGMALKAINAPSYWLSDLHRESNLSYGSKAYQQLDLYLPRQPGERNGQLVVFIYGGGWTAGSRENYYFIADAMTSAGYAVAIPDYIKYPDGQFPAFVEDVALSIAWLSANIGRFAEIDRLVIMGHSAGAHTGALIISDPGYLEAHGLDRNIVDAFVGMAGPYGFTPENEQFRNIFGNLQNYDRMRPLHFVDGKEPPMLLLHGEDDSTVLPANTREYAEKVNARGGTAVARLYEDKGHADLVLALARTFDREDVVLADILSFLERTASDTRRLACHKAKISSLASHADNLKPEIHHLMPQANQTSKH